MTRTLPAGDLGLLALTMVAAAADAISYLGLGEVFPANMTGNTVLMGIGLASGDYSKAAGSAVALGGFVFGAALSGVGGRGAARRLREKLGAEAVVLLAVGVLWAASGPHPEGGDRYALVAALGTAMGLQSGTVLGLGVGVSTTFITGTWTRISASIAELLRPGRPVQAAVTEPKPRRQIIVVVCYFAAAFLAGFAWVHAVAAG
jgi:uncharacterized membrane protein YoaK (UPF0700 family)